MKEKRGMKEHKEVRSISPELKAEALRLVREEFRTPASVAKELGVSKQSLSEWMKKEREEDARGRSGVALSDSERLELSRLRREVAKLRTEKDILKKAAAFFARENK